MCFILPLWLHVYAVLCGSASNMSILLSVVATSFCSLQTRLPACLFQRHLFHFCFDLSMFLESSLFRELFTFCTFPVVD